MTKPGETQTKSEIDPILEIEKVKKEADRLMMNKLKEIEELKETLQVREDTLGDVLNENENLKNNLNRTKKENNDLYNRIADLNETLKSKDYFEKPDYKFLVNENHRLEQQYLEVMADNKKLARQVEDRINQLRKAGM
tara:strand:- start:521 stop:934 length:414 start_codon:yes stop_codon:yes gene_type:complete